MMGDFFYLSKNKNCLRLLIVLILLTRVVVAQNLIPNPGFEANVEGFVSEWLQPAGDFYHYEARWIKKHHVKLERVNGLCCLNKRKTEFFLVKLIQPLEEGVTYVAKMDVVVQFKTQRSNTGIDSIDWKFLSEPINVNTRIFVKGVPDLSYDIREIFSPDQFTTFKKEYVARGDEKYLLVGKLRNPEVFGANMMHDSIVELFTAQRMAVDKTVRDELLAFSGTLMDVKNNNKAMRMMGRMQKKLNKRHQVSIDSVRQIYQPILDSLNNIVVDVPDRDVRYYFDNFVLVRKDQYQDEPLTAEWGMPFMPNETYRFNNVVFDTDKDILKTESYTELNNLIDIMKQYPKYFVKLTGHTDSVNTEEYNQVLSEQRVKACMNYLTSQGINPSRLKGEGKGETMPLATNGTEEGRALNRRVDFMFYLPGKKK